MYKDIMKKELIPGNGGENCPGNGENGEECCCDECDYLLCCVAEFSEEMCNDCEDTQCPRAQKHKQ